MASTDIDEYDELDEDVELDDDYDGEDDEDEVEVPDELKFSTGDDEDDVDSVEIELNGTKVTLYQPSNGALLMSAAAWSETGSAFERLHHTLNIINACLDDLGVRILREAMYSRKKKFKDEVLFDILDTILTRWGDGLGSAAPKNRAARRQAERAAKREEAAEAEGEQKSLPRKAPAKKAAAKRAPAKGRR
jgi:hypothetical protein